MARIFGANALASAAVRLGLMALTTAATGAVRLTFLASVLRIGSRPDSSRTGVMLPSAAVENEIRGARLVPAIVQLSLPRATTTSAAIRSAAAFAASAEAVATAGVNEATGTVIEIDSGVP